MRAGRLRQRVELQSLTEDQDDYGGLVKVWATQATVWAHVRPLLGREFFGAQQVQSDINCEIRTRYRSDITPTTKWRIVHENNEYDIKAVQHVDERHREWVFMCVLRNQEGDRG